MNPTLTLNAELGLLKQRVIGTVSVRGDKNYEKERTPWLEVVTQYPVAIVNAQSVQDIVETVNYARDNNLRLGVQNTGHGLARPCNGGILLRLAEMKSATVDATARSAIIEPGIQSGDLLAATEPHGLVFPSGQVSNVGVIGYTLGGGVGWLARKFGPACHAVKAATLVLADGAVVTASPDENSDLFWALRGGGGNFGVVASLTVELFPLGQVFGGLACYRMEDAPEVLRFYRDWSAQLTNDTSTVLRLMRVPPTPTNLLHLPGLQTCAIGLCHADEATAQTLHQQLLDFKVPVIDDLKLRPYSTMADIDQASTLQGASSWGNWECLRELSDNVQDKLLATTREYFPPLVLMEVQQLGGALNANADTGSYTAPQAPFALRLDSPTLSASLEELARDTHQAFDSLGDVYSGESSYNFLRGDQQDRLPSAFGDDKYQRLQSLKDRYDPDNFFSLNLNILPTDHSTKKQEQKNQIMKILVIGAAGKTGQAVVEQAVTAGHEVTAFVHKAEGYNGSGVRVIEGDAADAATMDAAVQGQDAVLDTIGGKTPYKDTTLESSVASTIIASMQRSGVRRLVVTSMLGQGDSTANAPIYERLLVATFLRGANKDKAAMESAVETSGLDWVILRPAILTDAPATGNVRVFDAQTGEKAHKITRADLAAFMLAQLSSDEHLYQAVTVANS